MGGQPSSLIAVAPGAVAKSLCLGEIEVEHDYGKSESRVRRNVARDVPVFKSLAHSLRESLIIV
jgi:hypothetical protein